MKKSLKNYTYKICDSFYTNIKEKCIKYYQRDYCYMP